MLSTDARIHFAIIGAQRCGTTELARQLSRHPDICFCYKKEPGYFNQSRDWRASLEEYHRLYEPREGQLCGEASTMYTFLPEHLDTHQRLFEYNPALKLIYIMRHPVERISSHYAHRLVNHRTTQPIELAVVSDPSFVNRSRYSVQIQPYLELFGANNILLLIFEEFVANPVMTLRQLAQFLNISPEPFGNADTTGHDSTSNRPYLSVSGRKIRNLKLVQAALPYVPRLLRNPAKRLFRQVLHTKPELPPELKEALWRLLEPDVRQMESLMQRPIHAWHTQSVPH